MGQLALIQGESVGTAQSMLLDMEELTQLKDEAEERLKEAYDQCTQVNRHQHTQLTRSLLQLHQSAVRA